MRTQVAIVGAGPAGLLLSHLLGQDGIESIVVETRTREYVEARIRAGILEHLHGRRARCVGLDGRLHRGGISTAGYTCSRPAERHHLDFVDLVGRTVWVYGQTEVTRDLVRSGTRPGSRSSTRSATPRCTMWTATGRT